MLWVSEQRLVDQANTIGKNSWMTELEIEELERKLAENHRCREEERSADDSGNNLGGELRDILTALEADGEIHNVEEEEVAIPMWRRTLQNKIREPMKDLSQLESSKDKEVSNVRH